MSTMMLCREMGTRYICDWQARALEIVLDKALQEGVEVDVAECFFTPGASKRLDAYSTKMRIINSQDKEKDAILEHNSQVSTERTTQRFRDTFESVEDLKLYLKQLESDKVVKVPIHVHEERAFRVLDLIFILRPDVPVSMGTVIIEYFKHVRNTWKYYNDSEHEYWELKGVTPVYVKAESGKCKSIVDGSVYDEDVFRRRSGVLPYRFGTRKLNEEEDFKRLIANAIEYLKTTAKPKRKKKTLMDYLESGEE